MKTLLLIVSFISFIGISQNWNLINTNRTVFFQHSDSTNITNTIVIDSTLINGVNANYYTGYAFKYCDTCANFSYYEPIIYRYAKELLGFNIENDITNNQYNLDNNTIQHHSQLGTNWQFNTSLTATVINTGEQTILGILDSVKTIQLSNTDTIIISKNYGVIRYPDFENIGKHYTMVGYHEGKNSYGNYLPNFWRTYDFNVGDVFCHRKRQGNGGTFKFYKDETKTTIINKTITSNSIEYTINTLAIHTFQQGPFGVDVTFHYSYTNSPGSILLENCNSLTENGFGIQKRNANIQYCTNTSNFFTSIFNENNYYILPDSIYYETYINTEYAHHSVFTEGITPNKKGKLIQIFKYLTDSLLIQAGYINALGVSYNNYGFTSEIFSHFEHSYTNNLDGSIINGDTTGIIFNFPDDLGFEEKSLQNQLNFYPNPATNQITLRGDFKSIAIFNNLGQLVFEQLNPNQIIEVNQLTKGLYFIKGVDKNDLIFTTKLILE